MDLDAYLARLGLARPPAADLAGLRQLQAAHQERVPFENLSIHLPEPIVLEPQALFDKVVGRHRGGFCYELNGLFAELLRGLGYRVDLLAARVFGKEGRPGIPFDHLALVVHLEERWLADVGFGRLSRHPLRLDATDVQDDADGTFQFATGEHGDLVLHQDGRPTYLLEPRPRELADFRPGCWWHATSPESGFQREVTCSLRTPDGRVTLTGRTLKTTVDGQQTERVLDTDAEVLDVYRDRFGINLDRVPTARGAAAVPA